MKGHKKNKSIPFGLSLPRYLLKLIDIERGDVTRSRFILRMLEKNISDCDIPEELVRQDQNDKTNSKSNMKENVLNGGDNVNV